MCPNSIPLSSVLHSVNYDALHNRYEVKYYVGEFSTISLSTTVNLSSLGKRWKGIIRKNITVHRRGKEAWRVRELGFQFLEF